MKFKTKVWYAKFVQDVRIEQKILKNMDLFKRNYFCEYDKNVGYWSFVTAVADTDGDRLYANENTWTQFQVFPKRFLVYARYWGNDLSAAKDDCRIMAAVADKILPKKYYFEISYSVKKGCPMFNYNSLNFDKMKHILYALLKFGRKHFEQFQRCL